MFYKISGGLLTYKPLFDNFCFFGFWVYSIKEIKVKDKETSVFLPNDKMTQIIEDVNKSHVIKRVFLLAEEMEDGFLIHDYLFDSEDEESEDEYEVLERKIDREINYIDEYKQKHAYLYTQAKNISEKDKLEKSEKEKKDKLEKELKQIRENEEYLKRLHNLLHMLFLEYKSRMYYEEKERQRDLDKDKEKEQEPYVR